MDLHYIDYLPPLTYTFLWWWWKVGQPNLV